MRTLRSLHATVQRWEVAFMVKRWKSRSRQTIKIFVDCVNVVGQRSHRRMLNIMLCNQICLQGHSNGCVMIRLERGKKGSG